MKRLPAVELSDVMESIEVQKGFSLEIVAAEPLVADPVDACFDADGQLYVAEMRGYPFSQYPVSYDESGPGRPDVGVVRLLQDTTGDGLMDKSHIFAKDISWPTSVCAFDGGVFVIAPPNLHYFKDTDGDFKADHHELIATGFDRNNVQGLANNLKWGLDGKIYGASGSNGGTLTRNGKELFSLRGQDFRFDPWTLEFEPVSGGRQFGHSMDDWGNRFEATNSNHIIQVVYPLEYLERNPYLAVSGTMKSIAKEGAAATVYRISPPEPWRIIRTKRRASDPSFAKRLSANELVPIGFFTSATGVTIYRGTAYPEEYQGNAFIGDVGGNLIHRKTLTLDGAAFLAERADQDTEFIRSRDTWFRPVNFVNAPDGTLMVLDMYRETIEHPYSIPEDIKKYLYLESGHDRGRVYRIVSPMMKQIQFPQLKDATSEQLVAELESLNSWNRETAQRLLLERKDLSVVPALEQLFETTNEPLGRLHALWTLRDLGALKPELIVAALSDSEPWVRVHALKLADAVIDENNDVASAALKLVDDPAFIVQWQLAFTLGELNSDESVKALISLAAKYPKDGDMRVAILSSVNPIAEQMAISVTKDYIENNQTSLSGYVVELARIVGARNQDAEVDHLLDVVLSYQDNLAAQRLVMSSLNEGLTRSGAGLTAYLVSNRPASAIKQKAEKQFEQAAEIAMDEDASETERSNAVEMLSFAEFELAAETLPDLLEAQVPRKLQLAAIDALAEQNQSSVGDILLENWKGYSPDVRNTVIEKMLARADRVQTLLSAVESGSVKPAEITQERKQLLQNHPDKNIKAKSLKLFQVASSEELVKVIAEYTAALSGKTDRERGHQVFVKNCAVCHQVGSEGHKVGPELASVKNKSEEDLLIAILDPNRETQANFVSYTAVSNDGKLYNGIITAESADSITLRQSEGKEITILRSNIDELVSSGLSLMPLGMEKNITPAQMADVVTFIKKIGEK
ncbi:PVC-type heme-binding CxxCH protein [Polystyrenella longa]|nr:PVC-type heme-binding CxxCH protein [Polystyrenella longa]